MHRLLVPIAALFIAASSSGASAETAAAAVPQAKADLEVMLKLPAKQVFGGMKRPTALASLMEKAVCPGCCATRRPQIA